MEKSYWKDERACAYEALNEDIDTDVVIIGGGLSGVMCAYELLQRKKRVCILEAEHIGFGETSRSSAMISFAHDLVYSRLIKKHGEKVAKRYLDLSRAGLAKIKTIIETHKIKCDFSSCDMILFARTRKGTKDIRAEKKAYDTLRQTSTLTTDTELPFPIRSGLRLKEKGYLNPNKFLHELCDIIVKQGGRIFEHARVFTQPENNCLKVGMHTIRANYFVMATHFSYPIVPGFYVAKVYQDRSHNIVFSSDRELRHLYESAEDKGFEYRPVADGILCGGANIRTGKYKCKSQYEIVENHIRAMFGAKEKDIISRFSAQDCMTFDSMPFVGQYSSFTKDLLLVTGFNKWGFTNAAVASEIIANIVEGKNTDDNIFDTKRMYLFNTPLKAVQNAGSIALGWAEALLNADAKKMERIRPGCGGIVKIKGKRLGVYRDRTLHVVCAVCPHMHCNLAWNKDERSWDCPCHGSRFDIDGTILSGPALECTHKVKLDNK